MVEQNRSGSYTQIVYSPTGAKLALMNGQTLQKSVIPLPAGATAVYTSSGLDHYRHPDWLGSARLGSSTSRSATGFVSYAPFGETAAQGGTADPSFTGQNQDTVSNPYDFPAREYDPLAGRWPSPDRAGKASTRVAFPQSWNRYAYVLNNPLGLIDPMGLDCVYLNDDGTSTQEIDTNSSASECGSTGGYWIPGTVDPNSIKIYSATGWITASSNAGLGWFGSACNGSGCGIDPTTALAYGPSSFGNSGIPTPANNNWVGADPVTGMPINGVPQNAQSPAQQFFNGMNETDLQLWYLNNALNQPFMSIEDGCRYLAWAGEGTAVVALPPIAGPLGLATGAGAWALGGLGVEESTLGLACAY